MQYPISLTPDRRQIAIMRVENGWLIRTESGFSGGGMETPLQVAETPEALTKIVAAWAVGQETPA